MDTKFDQLRTEYSNLCSEINIHSYRYHVLDAPIISDFEYDRLLARLKEIEESHPELVSSDSPTRRVGSVVSDRFVKVKHPAPVLSLANAFSFDEILSWYDRIRKIDERVESCSFVIEPKIDGLSVLLHYKNGLFVQGATRGDGENGEDISANLRTIRSIPMKIPVYLDGPKPPEYLVVRGEAYIPNKEFEELNAALLERGEKTYLNPRNTAAGSLRQLDPSLTASRPLTILTYSIIKADGETPKTQWETLEYLKHSGFPVAQEARLYTNIDEIKGAIDYWQKEREKLPYDADGIVIKINELNVASDLGFVGKDPRSAIAFKYPAHEVSTNLNDIGVNVGRTGVLTPYAILEPVEIGGVIVKQATLHNFDYIAEKDIRIGDRVLVKRAGEVIPYIIGPILEARTGKEKQYEILPNCPSCGQPVEHIKGEVAWYCVNLACPAQLVRNLEHFVSRSAMDIVGLGIKIVEQLVEAEVVKDPADLYRLTVDDLLKLEGFAEKKADNLIQSIEESKKQPLNRFITALGIRGIGEVMAVDLAKKYRDLDHLALASTIELMKSPGIGPNMAEAIVDWFGRTGNQNLLVKFKQYGLWPIEEASEIPLEPQNFAGMTFVITGTLPTFSREEMKVFIEKFGGKVIDSVSKKTSYLVLGENPGSKRDKALEIGVKIIGENDVIRLAEGK